MKAFGSFLDHVTFLTDDEENKCLDERIQEFTR
jgi:hypothetical protein